MSEFRSENVTVMNRQPIVNKAQCRKCEDIIESKYRHDFVTCSCGAISIDGGQSYLKRSAKDMNDVIELSEWE